MGNMLHSLLYNIKTDSRKNLVWYCCTYHNYTSLIYDPNPFRNKTTIHAANIQQRSGRSFCLVIRMGLVVASSCQSFLTNE